MLGCLASRDDAVRRAAIDAAIAFGDDAVGARCASGWPRLVDPVERRALEEVLGRVGGKDAFAALLAALDTPDLEAARAAALAVRQRVKETTATPRERASYLAQVTKFVHAKSKAKAKGSNGSSAREPGGGRRRARRSWVSSRIRRRCRCCSRSRATSDSRRCVREEAIVALRFVARGKPGARVAVALQELAERAPAELARPPCTRWPASRFRRARRALKKLALGRETERALLAIERLAQVALPAAADALAAVLTATEDRVRAEAAAAALGARAEGALALARALLATRDAERAALLARLLRPRLRALTEAGAAGKKLARAVVANALARIGDGEAGSDALLSLAREINRDATGAGLRALAASGRSAGTASAGWRCCGWSGTRATRRPTMATRWPPPSCAPGGATRRWRSCSSSSNGASTWPRAAPRPPDHARAALPGRLHADRAPPPRRRGDARRSGRPRPQQDRVDGQGQLKSAGYFVAGSSAAASACAVSRSWQPAPPAPCR